MSRSVVSGVLLFLFCMNAVEAKLFAADPAPTTFHIVGYLPDYRVDQINLAVGRMLTDLYYFSVVPEPDGKFKSISLESPNTKALLKRFQDESKTRIHLCIGGWERSEGFAAIAATPESRRRFAVGLLEFCREHRFAGADLDWEHPKNDAESKNYGLLLSEIAREFKSDGLKLTVAIAAWQTLTQEAINSIDAVHLMSYDAAGKHSTFEQAQADVKKLIDAGVPAKKIRLGVPFYGREIANPDVAKPYSEIVKLVKSPDVDQVDGLYFNGPTTIRKKTEFAFNQKLGGIMIWEIGQDVPGRASLLKIIHDTVK